jgi:hypothetical protein
VEQTNSIGRKGGRSKKVVKRNQPLTVKCNIIERKVIERKAKQAGRTVSEYLRTMGLAGKIDRSEKLIPKEILEYKGILNHIAANVNQIAKKANSGMMLDDYDKRVLFDLEKLIKQHIENATKYFQ